MLKVTGRVIANADRVLKIENVQGPAFYITTNLCACEAKEGETITVLIDHPASIGGASPEIFFLVEVIDPSLAPVL